MNPSMTKSITDNCIFRSRSRPCVPISCAPPTFQHTRITAGFIRKRFNKRTQSRSIWVNLFAHCATFFGSGYCHESHHPQCARQYFATLFFRGCVRTLFQCPQKKNKKSKDPLHLFGLLGARKFVPKHRLSDGECFQSARHRRRQRRRSGISVSSPMC